MSSLFAVFFEISPQEGDVQWNHNEEDEGTGGEDTAHTNVVGASAPLSKLQRTPPAVLRLAVHPKKVPRFSGEVTLVSITWRTGCSPAAAI